MSRLQLIAVVAATALTSSALTVGLTAAGDARAEAPREAVCDDFHTLEPGRTSAAIAAWMTAQLAAGRTQFSTTVFFETRTLVCAW